MGLAPAGPEDKIDPDHSFVAIQAMRMPVERRRWAHENGVQGNILLKAHGGLGDIICSEPSVNFALKTFKNVEISLLTDFPEFFQHHSFKKVYRIGDPELKVLDHYVYDMHAGNGDLPWDFICGITCHCIDFPSLTAFRAMLTKEYRQILLVPSREESFSVVWKLPKEGIVTLHPGAGWASKTFPKQWWDQVIRTLKRADLTPVLIGKKTAIGGTVDVNTSGCIDLREELSPMESVAVLQRSDVVLTNDSSPLHMAASGDAFVGFISLAKHPDYLIHTRHGAHGWRMEHFGKGGVWEHMDVCLNSGDVTAITDSQLDRWLPIPEDFANWAISKIHW